MDVITTEIRMTTNRVAEHSSEGISTARLRPSVPAISGEKLLALRLSQNPPGPLEPHVFGRVIVGGIRVVLGPRHSNRNAIAMQTTHAYYDEHNLLNVFVLSFSVR